MEYVIPVGIIFTTFFLLLKPRSKMLLAFFVMTLCFDLAPRKVYGRDIWDIGIVLLLLAWLQLILMKPGGQDFQYRYIKAIKLFLFWMGFCFLWSVFLNEYPVVETIQASRQMILGYLSFFAMLKLFADDERALRYFLKSFYVLTYVLLFVCMVQYALSRPLLSGLIIEYDGAVRALPVFLPICLLNFWIIATKIFSGKSFAFHEILYASLVFFLVLVTYTRGIYFAVAFTALVMLATLFLERRLKIERAGSVAALSVIFGALLISAGLLDRVIQRAASGVHLLTATNAPQKKIQDDTFSGRVALADERFKLVAERNPVVGFGFIHENNVLERLKIKFRYGSIVGTEKYRRQYAYTDQYTVALHSADIGWPNIAIDTGFVGFTLFMAFLVGFIVHYYKNTKIVRDDIYPVRLGFFLETVTLIMLMFNGSSFVSLVQIPLFMVAGYTICTKQFSKLSGNHAASVPI